MRFDYGDEVFLSAKDDGGNEAEKLCFVVGITPLENEQQARLFKYPVGTTLYTVEFLDGSDSLVSESDLRSAATVEKSKLAE